jgi:hypothetical protein
MPGPLPLSQPQQARMLFGEVQRLRSRPEGGAGMHPVVVLVRAGPASWLLRRPLLASAASRGTKAEHAAGGRRDGASYDANSYLAESVVHGTGESSRLAQHAVTNRHMHAVCRAKPLALVLPRHLESSSPSPWGGG